MQGMPPLTEATWPEAARRYLAAAATALYLSTAEVRPPPPASLQLLGPLANLLVQVRCACMCLRMLTSAVLSHSSPLFIIALNPHALMKTPNRPSFP